MRTKDEDLMRKIAECFNNLVKKNGSKPSTRMMGEELGINASTVSRYLKVMAEKNMLHYDDGVVRTRVSNKMKKRGMSIPLVGSISCGQPLLEEENIEAYYWLPEALFGKGEFFFLRANGDSMTGAGIDDGDLVLW